MKTIQDKYLVVGADFAGFPLKEVVVEHLQKKGWKITDLGVTADSDPDDTENMFHRVGLRVGAQISEGIFERALLFCGTGMGIHIAASKCPHVHAAYLGADLGSGYEWWKNFYEFHKLAIDELEMFDYEEYKRNGFKLKHLADYPLKLEVKPE